jgi:hypothetical protein
LTSSEPHATVEIERPESGNELLTKSTVLYSGTIRESNPKKIWTANAPGTGKAGFVLLVCFRKTVVDIKTND